ncbi:MAG TPA: phosphodiester glycosidase family protein [Phototrophicaceae bacterium]|nr:phosphodiester glycosidase family protein [Phototrophicaceae bacterium]
MDEFRYLAILLFQIADTWVWGLLAAGLFLAVFRLQQIKRRAKRKITRLVLTGNSLLLGIIAIFLGSSVVYQFWYTHRPVPTASQQTLFEGVTYKRDVRTVPRPLVIHVIEIDLTNDGVHFFVTPGAIGQEHPLQARTTSQFLQEFDLQIAINGDFFVPWWSNGIFNYYPHDGDPVSISGLASSEGITYSPNAANHPTLFISQQNEAQFTATDSAVFNAISGNLIFIESGKPIIPGGDYHRDLHPRTAIALNQDGTKLLLIVVDGRQPNYSEGVSMFELAEIALGYNGYTALNLDGGGSTTLVMEGENGQPILLNSPIDQRIPGRERPVANHLGLYAARIK